VADLSREPGIRQAEKIFGKAFAKELARFWSDLDGEVARSICNHAYGTMYSREVLSQRERELCVVMTLAALDKQPQLAAHIKAALHCGASRAEVMEVIVQAHLYAGIPATMNSLVTMRQVLSELPVEKRPRRKPRSRR
jgi:4-carboxymuconolactone decarboxylase